MNCCAPSVDLAVALAERKVTNDEVLLASRSIGNGLHQTELAIPSMHCGGCIRTIEAALAALPGVDQARVNLTRKRATVLWRADSPTPQFVETLRSIGYDAHLYDFGSDENDGTLAQLVRALAVAGFAASNIMLLSVSIWSGAEPETRNLFHWLSALIALPALAYSGRIFFRSAWRSLKHCRTNMDVPISIGVLMASGLSLYETMHHGPHAYFDASISLLFFLLIGRTLDHIMRERARAAVKGLERLSARGALVVQDNGAQTYIPVSELEPGMTILLAAGERVPVNACVVSGRSELDLSLVSGESRPHPVAPGAFLQSGTLNLTGPLTIRATAAAKDSFLAEMMQMMTTAESGRLAYRRIADRAAGLYAPVIHFAALLTCIGWIVVTGDVHRSITVAIAVLIITCPCALGLAVPMVHIVAARRLFENGIMLKDGAALERLAEIDTVVFDKTGVLTRGQPSLIHNQAADEKSFQLAAAIAAHSRHPYSRALATAGGQSSARRIALEDITEHPGLGLEAYIGHHVYRLGRADWALETSEWSLSKDREANVTLSKDRRFLASFGFDDDLRADVREALASLNTKGISVEIVSGDRITPVRDLALVLSIPYAAEVLPGDKAARVATINASGHKALMIGDGLNDAPALAAAHASMAPATAADIGRNAADFVFLRESLLAVPQAITIARNAARLVRQNLVLAIGYNAIAVPLAVLGYATPLIAAVAMSLSSLIVMTNALRLKGNQEARRFPNPITAARDVPPSAAVARG